MKPLKVSNFQMDLLKNLFESANQKKHLVHHPEATPNPDTKSVKTTLGQKIHEEDQPARDTKKASKKARQTEFMEGRKEVTKHKNEKIKERRKEESQKSKEEKHKEAKRKEEKTKKKEIRESEEASHRGESRDVKGKSIEAGNPASHSVHQSAVSLGKASQRSGKSSSGSASAKVLGKHSTSSPDHPVNTGKGIKNLKQYQNRSFQG